MAHRRPSSCPAAMSDARPHRNLLKYRHPGNPEAFKTAHWRRFWSGRVAIRGQKSALAPEKTHLEAIWRRFEARRASQARPIFQSICADDFAASNPV
jgi:hypothetical protein